MGLFTEPKVGPFSIAALVVGVGAIIGIIAIFLNWFEWSASWGSITIASSSMTGFDFLTTDGTDDFQKYCPFIAWLLMLFSLILAVLPAFKVELIPEKVSYLVIAVFGLLALIFVIMFLSWIDHEAIGAYMGLVASILVLVGGLLPVAEQFMK